MATDWGWDWDPSSKPNAHPELLAGTATKVRVKARKESRDFPSTATTMAMTPESLTLYVYKPLLQSWSHLIQRTLSGPGRDDYVRAEEQRWGGVSEVRKNNNNTVIPLIEYSCARPCVSPFTLQRWLLLTPLYK